MPLTPEQRSLFLEEKAALEQWRASAPGISHRRRKTEWFTGVRYWCNTSMFIIRSRVSGTYIILSNQM